MVAFIACLAGIAGYWAWQRARYEPAPAREANARALADAAALAMILAWIWIANVLGVRWRVIAAEGSAGATAGALVGVLLAGPIRRAVLRAFRLEPGATR